MEQPLRPYLKRLTLLCVDASPLIGTIYQDLFEILFHKVLITSSMAEAKEFMEKDAIDLVLTDVHLNDGDGMEFIAYLHEENPTLPVVLVTAFEDITVLSNALRYKVKHFVKKPFETGELLEAVELTVKQIIADTLLLEKHQQEVSLLQEDIYEKTYHERRVFQKELKIIRNDFYYQMGSEDCTLPTLVDFMYKPKEVISGDFYTARRINDHQHLYVIVDGMGKGFSASISAMMTLNRVNHLVDLCTNGEMPFNFRFIIEQMIRVACDVLLENEVLSIVFIVTDTQLRTLRYASFGMPPFCVWTGIITSNVTKQTISLSTPM